MSPAVVRQLETAGRRATRDWGDLLGYSSSALAEANLRALELYRDIADDVGMAREDVVISGCIGPKGDAYERNDELRETAASMYRSCRTHGETVRKLIDCLIAAVAVRAGAACRPSVSVPVDSVVAGRTRWRNGDAWD